MPFPLGTLMSILETDPNWKRGGGTINVTRRFVISAALLSVAGVCVALIVLPVVYAVIAPVPFYYENLPFKVCGSGTTSIETCIPNDESHAFHPGEVVPFIVDRCASDPFARSSQLPYVVSRNLVNVQNGTRIILPSLSTETPVGGCPQISITFAHQLPESVTPGQYYLEGVATVYGRFRTVNAYFQTEPFEVVKP